MKFKALIILTVLFLSACSLVNEPISDCPYSQADETITLSFQMMSSGIVSRSDSQNHDEVDSEYQQLEEGIDYSDLGIFIFARLVSDTDKDKNEQLVAKITDLTSSDNNIYITGSPGDYNVQIKMVRKELHDILFGENSEQNINPNGSDPILFRIIVIANSAPLGANGKPRWGNINGTTFQTVINQLSDWRYTMAYLYNVNYEGDDVAGIYTNSKKNIPMFGTNTFQTTQAQLYYSRPEDRVYLGELDLLRALAKVRVVDNMEKDELGYPKIVSAKFLGSQDEACQLPYDAINYVNATQVHTPNIAVPTNALNPVAPYVYRLGVLPGGVPMNPPLEHTGDVRVGYVPEQAIGEVDGDSYLGRPIIKLLVEFNEEDTEEFDIPMTQYGGQTFDFGDAILRNHIYTLSVGLAEPPSTSLTVIASVTPYTVVELDPIFGFDRPDPEKN